MVEGTPLTLRLGLIAGFIGLFVGSIVGFIAGYYGGWVDAFLRVVIDVGLTIPALADSDHSGDALQRRHDGQPDDVRYCLFSVALSGAYRARAGAYPERTQLRAARQAFRYERTRGDLRRNCCQTCCPIWWPGLVGSISAAVLAAIGLELLGLGPFEAPTLGMTLYWVNYNAAIINGWWWWWIPPILIIAILFTGLFLTAVGLDELANPRLRNQV